MNLKPIRDYIVVKPLDADNVTASGILIPDTAKEKPVKGIVLAVGTGKIAENGTIVPLVINEGQTVLFAKLAGTSFKNDNEEFTILREDDILAIIQ